MRKNQKRTGVIFVLLLCLLAVGSVLSLVFHLTPRELYQALGLYQSRCNGADGCFSFYQVGNGDCSAIYTDTVIGLVDTGTEDYARSLGDRLDQLRCKELDFVVISHPHDDHAGGYSYLLNRFDVKRLYIRDYTKEQLEDYAYYQNLLDLSRQNGVEVIHPEDGLHVQLDKVGLTFYRPSFYTRDENERCLLTMATVGTKRCFYVGDSGLLTEDVLLSRGYDIRADLLKVGHHGSKNGTSPEFLESVVPTYAIICVGYNTYGHPDDSVTGLLFDHGISLYRTDAYRDITFSVQGTKVQTKLQ